MEWLFVTISIFSAGVCTFMAHKNHRNILLAFVIGFFFNIIAIIGYLIAGKPKDSERENLFQRPEGNEIFSNWSQKEIAAFITICGIITSAFIIVIGTNSAEQRIASRTQNSNTDSQTNPQKETIKLPEYKVLSKTEHISTRGSESRAEYFGDILIKYEGVMNTPPEELGKLAESIAEREGLDHGASFYSTENAYKVNVTKIQDEETRQQWKRLDRKGVQDFSEISKGVEKFLPKEETQRLLNEGYLGRVEGGEFKTIPGTIYHQRHKPSSTESQ